MCHGAGEWMDQRLCYSVPLGGTKMKGWGWRVGAGGGGGGGGRRIGSGPGPGPGHEARGVSGK